MVVNSTCSSALAVVSAVDETSQTAVTVPGSDRENAWMVRVMWVVLLMVPCAGVVVTPLLQATK